MSYNAECVTATMGLFLWSRLRHDVVALAALMACVVAGVVPGAEAFAGFGHPAVITVADIPSSETHPAWFGRPVC